MKTAYIGQLYNNPKFSKEKLVQQTFVIGVKGNSICSLEALVKSVPQIRIVTRLPEVVNGNYPNNPAEHTLQPAFIIWEETSSPKKAPDVPKTQGAQAVNSLRSQGLVGGYAYGSTQGTRDV